MLTWKLLLPIVLTGRLALGAMADDDGGTRVVTLPGPPASAAAKSSASARVTERGNSAPLLQKAATALPQAAYPEDLDRDSGAFCQKQIGRWTERDARAVLGPPRGQRPAFNLENAEDGRVFAFSDPSGRHMQLELDFDGATGLLRTVFVYPWDMRWDDCRRLWGLNVSAARANKGRMFYSYLDHRVDVLVEPGGKVVSLGLY